MNNLLLLLLFYTSYIIIEKKILNLNKKFTIIFKNHVQVKKHVNLVKLFLGDKKTDIKLSGLAPSLPVVGQTRAHSLSFFIFLLIPFLKNNIL